MGSLGPGRIDGDRNVVTERLGQDERGLRLAGILEWHRKSGRYKESLLRYRPAPGQPLGALTGLGTSAARMARAEP
jgi:hypothetical protein